MNTKCYFNSQNDQLKFQTGIEMVSNLTLSNRINDASTYVAPKRRRQTEYWKGLLPHNTHIVQIYTFISNISRPRSNEEIIVFKSDVSIPKKIFFSNYQWSKKKEITTKM